MSTVPSATVPRDILRWVQGLDLSYSIKNVRRSCSNGFVVAEIFSRYHPKALSMHSFDTGTQMARKADNWDQLEKFFRKSGVPIRRSDWEPVMRSEEGAAVLLLEKMYTHLTGKKPAQSRAVAEEKIARAKANPPPFARDTASGAVRRKGMRLSTTAASAASATSSAAAAGMGASSVLPPIADERAQREAAERAIREHLGEERSLRDEDPDRFAVPTKTRPAPSRTTTRTLQRSGTQEAPPIQFREVAVRPLDVNAAEVRAMRDPSAPLPPQHGHTQQQGMQHQHSRLSLARDGGTTASLSGLAQRSPSLRGPANPAANPPANPVLTLLSGAVATHAEHEPSLRPLTVNNGGSYEHQPFISDGVNNNAFRSMVSSSAQLPSSAVSGCLDYVSSALSGQLAAAVVSDPREFWPLFASVAPLLSGPEDSEVFGSAVGLMVEVGAACVASDPAGTWAAFESFALQRIVELMRGSPGKRYDLLRIVYNFCSNDVSTHITVIRRLRDLFVSGAGRGPTDRDALLHCLTLTVFLESSFDDDLLDLYVYYCSVGACHASPSVRASSLSMLAVVADEGPDIAVQMAPRLLELSTDTWWEVRAQCALCCAYILEHLPGGDPRARPIIEAASRVLVPPGGGSSGASAGGSPGHRVHAVRPVPNARVAKVALSYLARCLSGHDELAAPYLECLLLLPPAERAGLLREGAQGDPQPSLGVLGRVVGNYRTVRLPDEWDGASLMRAVGRAARESGLGNLDTCHMDVLVACAECIPSSDDPGASTTVEEADRWTQAFDAVRDYVFVALCDEDLVTEAAAVVDAVFRGLGSHVFPSLPTLASTLQMLFPDGPHGAQEHVQEILTGLYNSGEPWSRAVAQTLLGLPDSAKNSSLASLVSYVSRNG